MLYVLTFCSCWSSCRRLLLHRCYSCGCCGRRWFLSSWGFRRSSRWVSDLRWQSLAHLLGPAIPWVWRWTDLRCFVADLRTRVANVKLKFNFICFSVASFTAIACAAPVAQINITFLTCVARFTKVRILEFYLDIDRFSTLTCATCINKATYTK